MGEVGGPPHLIVKVALAKTRKLTPDMETLSQN